MISKWIHLNSNFLSTATGFFSARQREIKTRGRLVGLQPRSKVQTNGERVEDGEEITPGTIRCQALSLRDRRTQLSVITTGHKEAISETSGARARYSK